MKDKLITILTVIMIGVLLVVLQSCKKDDVSPSEEDLFKSKISRSWKVRRVTVDGVDVTGAFKGMIINFKTDGSYVVTNSVAPIWPSTGTFEVLENKIKRSDGVIVDATSLTESSVILELLYTPAAGRVKEVTGRYKFEMNL
jgi:hypothetical protein